MRAQADGAVSPRLGVHEKVLRRYLEARGWRFTPTSGCKLSDLPRGRLIALLDDHVLALIDGIARDDSRDHLQSNVDSYWARSPRMTEIVPTFAEVSTARIDPVSADVSIAEIEPTFDEVAAVTVEQVFVAVSVLELPQVYADASIVETC
jgi:hypothetical protein